MFVTNRVREIQELSDPSTWFHLKGSDNPADLLTRGVLADHLVGNKLWWHGPAWLANGLTPDDQLGGASPVEEEEMGSAVMAVQEVP